MSREPVWLNELEADDLQFIRRFVLASGSLKELASQYSVSYPTLRARLDRLIARIQAIEDPSPADEFERKVRILVADGQLSATMGKNLLKAHRASMSKNAHKRGKQK